jgi:hypothetical protein
MPAIFGYDDVGNHANMLLDAPRVEAFARAIKEVVRPDDVVADIGSGTGLLAVLAKKAGARRVFAVERGPLPSCIERTAKENGVELELIRGDAREVAFPEPPTLIVSEMLGSFAPDEDALGMMGVVKAKSHPRVRMLPENFEVLLGLADVVALGSELSFLRDELPVKLGWLVEHLQQRVSLGWAEEHELLGPMASTGVRTLGVDGADKAFRGRVRVARNGNANALVSWFRTQLSPSVSLMSGPGPVSPNWAHVIFPLGPTLAVKEGDEVDLEVRPRLLTDRGTWAWRASDASGTGQVRSGDAMRSLVGTKEDILDALGLAERVVARDI